MIPLISALVIAFQVAPGGALPDQVKLKNGDVVTGRVVTEDEDALRVRTARGDLAIQRDRVTGVRSLETSLADAIARFDAMNRDDPVALDELARFCRSRGLEGEARNAWIRTLTLDP